MKKSKTKTLYRSSKDKILGGVCGGIGDYFDTDSTIIRLLFILIMLTHGIGIPIYILCWIIIPKNPK